MPDEPTFDFKDLQRRMHGAVEALKGEFSGLRTGRASSGLLEPVLVEAGHQADDESTHPQSQHGQ